MKKSFISILFSFVISLPILSGVCFGNNSSALEVDAASTISTPVTRVYIEDQAGTNTRVIAIESITFDTSNGYGHDQWREFLKDYLGTRKTYNTSDYTTYPTKKGWSYMSADEDQKYLLCPTGGINFTMIFPEWVTAFSYKAVGMNNSSWCWYDVNNQPVGLHSGWGIKKKVNSYIYNDGGVKMNANLDNTDQYNAWGDSTLIVRNMKADTTDVFLVDTIVMPRYYRPTTYHPYNIFGYTFGGYYSGTGLKVEFTSILTNIASSTTLNAKQTPIEESYIAGTMNGWNGSDPEYLMLPGDNEQYVIHATLEADTEFKVVYQSNWYGYSQVDTESHLVQNGSISVGTDPDNTGSRIKVNKTGLYEIYFKTTWENNRIWIQQDSEVEASEYATTFLSTITCSSSSTSFSLSEWNHTQGDTSSMEYLFGQLDSGAKDILRAANANELGTDIEQCIARYERILSKYGYGDEDGQYHDFMEREPSVLSSSKGIPAIFNISTSNNIVPIIIVVSLIFGVSVGGYFLIRKREEK